MTQASLLDAVLPEVAVPDRLLVLRYLQAHRNQWIALPQLARETGVSGFSITARIRDLRKPQYGGYVIENQQQRVEGVCWSSYRLVA
jgi:hypothetical protein